MFMLQSAVLLDSFLFDKLIVKASIKSVLILINIFYYSRYNFIIFIDCSIKQQLFTTVSKTMQSLKL